uniref:Uncharacterized protein n=1 Tax=Arundo donax TaxID=35708 RepID=A0A0A9D2I8_ARUDO
MNILVKCTVESTWTFDYDILQWYNSIMEHFYSILVPIQTTLGKTQHSLLSTSPSPTRESMEHQYRLTYHLPNMTTGEFNRSSRKDDSPTYAAASAELSPGLLSVSICSAGGS